MWKRAVRARLCLIYMSILRREKAGELASVGVRVLAPAVDGVPVVKVARSACWDVACFHRDTMKEISCSHAHGVMSLECSINVCD